MQSSSFSIARKNLYENLFLEEIIQISCHISRLLRKTENAIRYNQIIENLSNDPDLLCFYLTKKSLDHLFSVFHNIHDFAEIIEPLLKENKEYLGSIFFDALETLPLIYTKWNLETYSGTGGDEAGIWAEELFKTFKDIIDYSLEKNLFLMPIKIIKDKRFECFGGIWPLLLLWESGVHRVQRVPSTENKGRIHTSTGIVCFTPDLLDEELNINVQAKDIRLDIYRASGKGGQNVNKVSTAVRIVHLETNITVTCQDERSQLINKEKAKERLIKELKAFRLKERITKILSQRKNIIKTGNRGEQIKTWNWPENRITDHRSKIKNPLSGLGILYLNNFFEINYKAIIQTLIEFLKKKLEDFFQSY